MSEIQTPPGIPDLDTNMESPEPKYGGFSRFEIELEFVQALASPLYLNYLASQKYFDNPAFIAYLDYLQYWSHPLYVKYLIYPGPTLRNLELLQHESFRMDIISPEVVRVMVEEGIKNGTIGPGGMTGQSTRETEANS